MPALGPHSTGRWLIHSERAVHVLDLGAWTYERRPRPTSQAFAYDHRVLGLVRVGLWPEVGGRMIVWFDDPEPPHLSEHYRISSRICSIIETQDEQL